MTIPSLASPGIGTSLTDSVQQLINAANRTSVGVFLYPPTTVLGLASLSPSQGARGMVTDANEDWGDIGTAPTGTGTTVLPVYYDGSAWLIG